MRDIESRLAALEARVRGVEDVEGRVAALEQAVWQHWGRPGGQRHEARVLVVGLYDRPVVGATVTATWSGGEASAETDAEGKVALSLSIPYGTTVDVVYEVDKPPRWKPKTFSVSTVGYAGGSDHTLEMARDDDGAFDATFIGDGYHISNTNIFADPSASDLVVEDPLHGDVSLTNTGGPEDGTWSSGAITLDHPGGGGCGAVDDVPALLTWPTLGWGVLQVDYRKVGGCPAAGGAINASVSSGGDPAVVETTEPQSCTVHFDADPWWGGAARTIRIREA